MIFKLCINKELPEEITATVHERSPLVDEIERLVLRESCPDQIPGYWEDEIRMLPLAEIQCFVVDGEKTYAITGERKRYQIRKRLYELEDSLPASFRRISKSAIANWTKVTRLKVQLSGAVDAVFQCGYVECISRRCFSELKRRYEL